MHRLFARQNFIAAVVSVIALAVALVGVHWIGAAGAATPASPWSQSGYNAAQSEANLVETTLSRSTLTSVSYRRSVVAAPVPPIGCGSDGIVGPVLSGGEMIAVMGGVLTNYVAATGRVVWRNTPDRTYSTIYESVAVANGVVVLSSTDCGSVSAPLGTVAAFRLSTGAKLWSATIGGLSGMVVSGGYVVGLGSSLDDGTTVGVYKLSTGAVVWQKQYDFCFQSGAFVVAGKVLYNTCENNSAPILNADNLVTGARVWSRAGGWQVQRGDTDIVSTGHHIYLSNSSGTVVDVNPKSGATKFKLGGARHVGVVDSARVYAVCETGNVCGYNIAAGGRLWMVSNAAAPVAEADGALYLADGTVLNTSNGALITVLTSAAVGPSAVGDGRIAIVANPRIIDLYGLAGS